jgi:hypothetical protein
VVDGSGSVTEADDAIRRIVASRFDP